MIPRRRSALVAGLALVMVTAGALALRGGRASDGTPLAGAATAPVSLMPSCQADSTAEPLLMDIAGFAYCPTTLTVPVGVEVAWTNGDLAPHTVTYDGPDGKVDSGSMVQGQSWSTIFDHPGTLQYYCRFHPGMTGTIVVHSSR